MARYTNFFMTASPQQAISQALVSALEACNLNLVYQDPVCIVAKERPGQVSFAQLATVELLISPPTLENGGSKVDLVVKNEELPLRTQNHCREIFVQINQAIANANEQQTHPKADPKAEQKTVSEVALPEPPELIEPSGVESQSIEPQGFESEKTDAKGMGVQNIDAKDIDAKDIDAKDIDAKDIDAKDIGNHGISAQSAQAQGIEL
ncbi:MAG: hypothetical protein HLUCCA11_04745 [Phormidesmis priestleyi Ana]|uniref:Uncharacterized protein n=1 Tax=Phormidesmis priestleyi Ana TaxID=1666911 RepID=A0A0P7ZTC2_9CYAN|nr:MAG: hypothetical protein HLUCCA11_04745 [Phormidesmis priestleyi Ana]